MGGAPSRRPYPWSGLNNRGAEVRDGDRECCRIARGTPARLGVGGVGAAGVGVGVPVGPVGLRRGERAGMRRLRRSDAHVGRDESAVETAPGRVSMAMGRYACDACGGGARPREAALSGSTTVLGEAGGGAAGNAAPARKSLKEGEILCVALDGTGVPDRARAAAHTYSAAWKKSTMATAFGNHSAYSRRSHAAPSPMHTPTLSGAQPAAADLAELPGLFEYPDLVASLGETQGGGESPDPAAGNQDLPEAHQPSLLVAGTMGSTERCPGGIMCSLTACPSATRAAHDLDYA